MRLPLAVFLALLVIFSGCVSVENGKGRIETTSAKPEFYPLEENLTIIFVPVGQGDSIVLSKGNFTLLVDGGKPGSEGAVIEALDSTGDGTVEIAVATHPDSDHIGGLAGIMKEFPPSQVWDSGTPEDTKAYLSYISEAKKTEIIYPKKGANFSFSGVELSILNPGEILSDEKNENSIVILASYGAIDILLTGDCEGACEKAIEASVPDIEILKVAHHGSKYATGEKFLSRAKPEVSVISVGKNSYGHPANETVLRLENAGSLVLRTDLEGTVEIRTDGKEVWANGKRVAMG